MDAKDNRFYRESKSALVDRLQIEADLCDCETAHDIAQLLREAAAELEAPESVSFLNATAWLMNRGAILGAIDEKGYVILSDSNGFRMELKK